MSERILSKTQARVFIALGQQKAELQKQYQEIMDAEAEQVELLREKFGLPEGVYQLRQEPGGELVLFAPDVPTVEEE